MSFTIDVKATNKPKLKFDPFLRQNAVLVRMFYFLHIRNEIGQIQEFPRGISSGDHHVEIRSSVDEGIHDCIRVQKSKCHKIGEFIQKYHEIIGGTEFLFGQIPSFEGDDTIFFKVVGFECKPVSHDIKIHQIHVSLHGIEFTILPASFDKLNDADFLAMPQGPEGLPQCCGGFSFTVSRIYHE